MRKYTSFIKQSILNMIKKINHLSLGLLSKIYFNTIEIIGAPRLYLIRWRLLRSLSIRDKINYLNIKFVVFPNGLTNVHNLLASGYAIEKILKVCGIKVRQFNPWARFDYILNWQDVTVNSIDSKNYIQESCIYTKKDKYSTQGFVNFECFDISKKKIGATNFKIFGYDLDVNPCTHHGYAVCKSNENATHDGEIITCPVAADQVDSSKVYNIVVDNTHEGEVVDFRVPYINGVTKFIYEKRRPLQSRFSNDNTETILRESSDVFSVNEIKLIESFVEELGANYGELDVLRDKGTGKIYIVDFAKTPAGPPNGLSKKDSYKAIEMMSDAFIKNIILKNKSIFP